MKLAMIGKGGHGSVCSEIARMLEYDVEFFDDLKGPSVDELIANRRMYTGAFVSIGNSAVRERVCGILKSADIGLMTLIHPRAIVSYSAEIAPGSVVMAGAVIAANAKLGRGCIVNHNATIDHDCVIGSYSHVCPGTSLAGSVVVGERSKIGIGSAVRQEINIGDDVTVGAGSAVVSNIPSGQTVAGTPAKPIRRREGLAA